MPFPSRPRCFAVVWIHSPPPRWCGQAQLAPQQATKMTRWAGEVTWGYGTCFSCGRPPVQFLAPECRRAKLRRLSRNLGPETALGCPQWSRADADVPGCPQPAQVVPNSLRLSLALSDCPRMPQAVPDSLRLSLVRLNVPSLASSLCWLTETVPASMGKVMSVHKSEERTRSAPALLPLPL